MSIAGRPDTISDFEPSARRVHGSTYETISNRTGDFGLNIDWKSLLRHWKTNPAEAALITVVGAAIIAVSYPEFKIRQEIQKQTPQTA